MITIDQFKETEIKIGEILSVEKVEGADKLLKLMVDFGLKPVIMPVPTEVAPASEPILEPSEGQKDIRQIISGIALYFPDPQTLVGVKCAFVTNLEPRTIRGLTSNGMILAAGGGGETFTLLRALPSVSPGTPVK
jgi:methionyl-tRNA synthetase